MDSDSNKTTDLSGDAKAAQAEADAILAMNKTDPETHVHKYRKYVIGFTLLMFLVVGGLFISSFSGTDDKSDQASSADSAQQGVDSEPEAVAVQPVSSVFESEYALTATDGCEERANFVDVTKFDGPGGDYTAPTLEVSCTEDEITVASNNMPLWEFIELTPNPLEAQDYSWTISKNPTLASSLTQIGYQDAANSTLGTLGFSVSGLIFYGPTEGPFPDPYGDPFTNSIIDDCGGHTGPNGEYHEHIMVTKCFFPDWDESQVAPVVGYALDGFPIYGPTGFTSADSSEVIEFKSSYEVTGDLKEYAWDNVDFVGGQGDEYLDECNGRTQPDGSYGYHLTSGFPYIIGCFAGEVDLPSGGGAGGRR